MRVGADGTKEEVNMGLSRVRRGGCWFFLYDDVFSTNQGRGRPPRDMLVSTIDDDQNVMPLKPNAWGSTCPRLPEACR